MLSKSDVLKREETAVLRQRLSDAFPGATVLSASAQTGEGMDEWIDWLKEETSSWNESNEKGVKE